MVNPNGAGGIPPNLNGFGGVGAGIGHGIAEAGKAFLQSYLQAHAESQHYAQLQQQAELRKMELQQQAQFHMGQLGLSQQKQAEAVRYHGIEAEQRQRATEAENKRAAAQALAHGGAPTTAAQFLTDQIPSIPPKVPPGVEPVGPPAPGDPFALARAESDKSQSEAHRRKMQEASVAPSIHGQNQQKLELQHNLFEVSQKEATGQPLTPAEQQIKAEAVAQKLTPLERPPRGAAGSLSDQQRDYNKELGLINTQLTAALKEPSSSRRAAAITAVMAQKAELDRKFNKTRTDPAAAGPPATAPPAGGAGLATKAAQLATQRFGAGATPEQINAILHELGGATK